jgi:6-phosphogluconolactonase
LVGLGVFAGEMKIPRILQLTFTAMTTLVFSLLAGTGAESAPSSDSSQYLVYIGTYTGAKSKGVYVSRLERATGKLGAPELVAETPNPTFLAVHPKVPALYATGRPTLYAANEVGGGGKSGSVTAFAIDRATGKLTRLTEQSSRGAGPCHVSVDREGKCVLVANYGSGSIAALPLKADGSVGEATAFIQHTGSSVNKQRQQGPHAHWIDVSPDNQFAFVCDLGLDKVMIYKLNAAEGTLTESDPAFATVKAGSGPRHLAIHPNGRFAYVNTEMGNTVTVFAYDAARGAFQEIESQPTLPKEFSGQSSTAEVEVHPSGKFLYCSNRGHDSIVAYAIDQETGKLSLLGHQATLGKTPRNFAIEPSGQWLLAANQSTDNVVMFRVDVRTGRISPTGQSIEVGAPVCVKFVPVK